MKSKALTQFGAKNLPAGKYADGEGLWLVKRDKVHGKWSLRLVVHSKRREMGLGRWPDVSIGEARGKAEDARSLLRGSVDPIFARRRAKAAGAPLTLKQAVASCFEARKAELKDEGEAGRWMSALSVHIIPKIGSYPVQEVDQHVLKEVLDPIWHTKPEAAVKALNRLSLTLKHAAALGIPVDLQATMKARALLGKQRRTEVHIPSLAYEEAPTFYRSLGTNVSSLALRFLMLTLARSGEVRAAPASEITGDVWDIPPERTKTATGRRVPPVKEAVKVVGLCGEALFAADSLLAHEIVVVAADPFTRAEVL